MVTAIDLKKLSIIFPVILNDLLQNNLFLFTLISGFKMFIVLLLLSNVSITGFANVYMDNFWHV